MKIPTQKKETLAEITAENKRLELEIKRQEFRNKLESLKGRGITILFEIPNENTTRNNKPSFFGNITSSFKK